MNCSLRKQYWKPLILSKKIKKGLRGKFSNHFGRPHRKNIEQILAELEQIESLIINNKD